MQSLPSLLGGQDGGNFDGLSGMMGMGGLLQGMGGAGGPQMNGMHIQPGQTVHAHASDKPGTMVSFMCDREKVKIVKRAYSK